MTEQAQEVEQVSMEEFAKEVDEVLEFLQQIADYPGGQEDVDLAKKTANVIATMAGIIDELQRRLQTVHYASQWQLTLTRPKEQPDEQ